MPEAAAGRDALDAFGRKFIRSNEIVKLERFQEQIRKFKKLTEPGSKLVKG